MCTHAKECCFTAAHKVSEAKNVDCLVSLGGSSVIDLTKGVALVLAEGEDLEHCHVRFSPSNGMQAPNLPHQKLPHIALPTTLSGSEFTNVLGITDESKGVKNLYMDYKLTPKWVLLDPELTCSTPSVLWAGTGMKVFADCLEELCSPRANPFTDALALEALNILYNQLPLSVATPEEKDARYHRLAHRE